MKYNHKEIEKKWQKIWEESDLYKTQDNPNLEKKYILDMFPYPSGDGLHIGHVEGYTATDIYSRYLRMQGKYNVLHPMGWDAFGLPAENYAIKTGAHPDDSTHVNIKNFTQQMKALGLSYDWSREIDSSKSEYYKWTQWFFLLLYNNGLAYKKKAKVNWCNSCNTVLANEQAEGGKCDRCDSEVIQKDLSQWFFKITDFVDDQIYEGIKIKGLLNGLDSIDWPESTKAAQKNWIGRSEGARVKFSIKSKESGESEDGIEVFTTRPDTLFGATYFVVAPEHEVVEKYQADIKNYKAVEEYIEKAKKKTELERTDLAKDKSGVCLEGVVVVNPVNGEEIPVFVADYVLSTYGTGAIMAVPAHDERDFEFAQKYGLAIKEVVKPVNGANTVEDGTCFKDEGIAVNSGFLDGLKTSEAKKKMISWLEEKDLGKKEVNFRLRDWLVSRQRYWGAPIPIVYCDDCGEVAIPVEDLPVKLPTDVDFKPTGESPLVYSKTFHDVKCPKCGKDARRESDTMDTFVCSSWYYLRFADPNNEREFASKENIDKWLPVDTYVGGAEHTVLHLLYARFFTKVLQKYSFVDFNEPFAKLRHQGLIMAEDGNKMSKSKGNVINPNTVIETHGADALRMYEMFMGPLEDMKPWNMQGIAGLSRFLEKVIKLGSRVKPGFDETKKDLSSLLHKTIKKVSDDIPNFKFNTAIAQMMILLNAWEKEIEICQSDFEKFLLVLSSFAPHLTEELWESLGHKESIFKTNWPSFDLELIKEDTVKLVVQVNGKLRDTIEVDADISEEEALKLVKQSPKIQKWLEEKEIVKEIFIKGKLVNIVVK